MEGAKMESFKIDRGSFEIDGWESVWRSIGARWFRYRGVEYRKASSRGILRR